jgi:UDP-N-acetylglucosamine 4,6-dehydratase/5-epimerase
MVNKTKIFKGKTVFITGGTGSFGKFFINRVLEYNPKKIIIFSRDEDKQYTLQNDLKKYSKKLRFVIGDVRDKDSLLKATKGDIDILIHAAALKQVPSAEYNVFEAVKTNVIGAQNVVDACIENNIPKALSVSTDKAVEPINAYGMTKGLQERIFVLGNKNREKNSTKFSSVRYGNVIASRGSVIPLFKKQIENGGPITLTHKDMTRFILTLDQAFELVSLALSNMVGGEIFIPKINPIKISDLASVMVDLLKPNDPRILETGIRPGEKFHETLISPLESIRTIVKKDYYIVLPQIEVEDIGFTYNIGNYKSLKTFRDSSDNGPFLTKDQIKKILKEEKII